jgi:hypothetical protein
MNEVHGLYDDPRDDWRDVDGFGAPELMTLADFIDAELMERILWEAEFEFVERCSVDDYVFV